MSDVPFEDGPDAVIADLAGKLADARAELRRLRAHLELCPYTDVEWWCMCLPGHIDPDCAEVFDHDDPESDYVKRANRE